MTLMANSKNPLYHSVSLWTRSILFMNSAVGTIIKAIKTIVINQDSDSIDQRLRWEAPYITQQRKPKTGAIPKNADH